MQHELSGSWSVTTLNGPTRTRRPRRLVVHLQWLTAGSYGSSDRRRDEVHGGLRTKLGLRATRRRTNGGQRRVDAAAVKREVLRHHLNPNDPTAAYKQLLQVERGWRDMRRAGRPQQDVERTLPRSPRSPRYG